MSTRDLVLISTFVNALILGLLLVISTEKREIEVVMAPKIEKAVLKTVSVPVSVPVIEAVEVAAEEPLPPPPPQDEWYVIKSGDNPWKVAKTQKIKFDDLLKLNGLNEERARNLKPGDRIRIR